jgi:hypothetical protein
MNWTRIGIATLCSGWFFLASCTTGAIVGTRIVAMVDTRDASDGDEMHHLFSVVVPSSEADSSFVVLGLDGVMANPAAYAPFWMPDGYGKTEDRDSYYSFSVLEQTDEWQIIEVVEEYRDGDNTIWSRYRADDKSITPISSRMMYFGYVFAAMPYAIGFAFLLYFVGRVLAWRNQAIMNPSVEHGDT